MSDGKLEVVCAKYTEPTHSQMLVTLRNASCVEFKYFFTPNQEDISPIYVFLQELYDKGEIKATIDTDSDRVLLSRDIVYKRNSLLSQTDYLMNPDYPISDSKKEELRVYRQSLRDITDQKGYPENVVWPEMPHI